MYTQIIIIKIINNFLSKHIIMVKLTTYELKFVAKNRSIKNYQSMSREKLLSTLDESERITENLSKNGLERIARMQNLLQDDLDQIKRIYRI